MTAERQAHRSRGQVPGPDGVIVVSDGQHPPVGAERQAVDRTRVLEREQGPQGVTLRASQRLASQTRIERSRLPAAKSRPSGLKARLVPCSRSVILRLELGDGIAPPLAASQIFTTPPESAEASHRPSGLKATLSDGVRWPRSRWMSFP